MKGFLLFIISTLFIPSLHAETANSKWLSDWEKEDSYEGVEIECRQHKSKINECRYTTLTDFSPDTLLAVNIDGPNLKNWMENITVSEPFDVQSQFNYKMYSQYNFPGARNRDSVTHSTITKHPKNNTIRLDFKSVKHPDKPKDLSFVRFVAIKGFWEFSTLANDQTKIVYQNIALPGEYVQKVLYPLYNFSTREAGAKTVVNLLSEAKKDKYQNLKLNYPLAQK